MSTIVINKIENEVEKTLDKKQIEAEEKEVMLKTEADNEDDVELRRDGGFVKTALSGDITEQGREVKPKFIPIGAIKMPGFFTRNSDREKSKEEEAIEKDTETEKCQDQRDGDSHPKNHFKLLQSWPFTSFLQNSHNDSEGNAEKSRSFAIFNSLKYPKMFNKQTRKNAEATLASMETLEDKLDTTNDGMENIKLDVAEPEDGKVSTKLPLKERIRQKKIIIDDIVVCVVVLLVILAVIIGVSIGALAGPPSERPLRLGKFITTQTTCGLVEGLLDEGVYKFYGIPYASPPIDERRFSYAQPLNNLSLCWNDTLRALEPTPRCMQFLENRTIIGEEDCLTLDVVTPHVRYDSPLPVVVLIGANTLAGGVSPARPSALYARTKEVVFVRPNFRLGSFGFLALDIISKSRYPETSGNYALSDLVVALQWIKYNIKHFGGDAESVTLLGHRAGATLTAALTTSKKAQKLFSRVWLSSASVIFPGEALELSERNNEEFKQMSKCDDIDCLRNMSPLEIMSSTPVTWLGTSAELLPLFGEDKRSWLVLDGDLLRTHAYESWDAQREAKKEGKEKVFKPMVFGTTQHSGHCEFLNMKNADWTAEALEDIVNESYIGKKNLTATVFKHFNKTYEGLVGLISSIRTLCPLVTLARMRLAAPMYVVLGSGPGGGINGTGIAGVDSDVEAILGTFDSEVPEQRRYMAAMQQLFYYYVWHGRLSGPESGLIAVGQDLLPHLGLPVCDMLIQEDLVPRYAHID
ncbi:neurotactin [Pieris brassicae]|uniref:neurotactin n=1 Tax=Pieris brassicae TaxID=7116 RepID=UPI001E65F24F|nr:neurotactin [Pieris brassicae]